MKEIKNQAGISTLEVIITLSIMSVISVASVWLVFTTLSLRDQVLATTTTAESLRVFSHSLSSGIQKASVVSSSPTTLFLTSANECWSFIYDSSVKNIYYASSMASGCTPNLSPNLLFFPSNTQVTSFTFQLNPLSTGGRQITASGVVNTILPFGNYLINFSDTFTNLVD